MSGFGGLIKQNATVRIESLTITQDQSGGTVEDYATLADDVPVLVTLTSGSRDGRFTGQNDVLSGTLTGFNAYLDRADIRIYFKTAEDSTIAPAVGSYGYVDSPTAHASGRYLVPGNRYTLAWSTYRPMS
jgi:hypothetical protein